MEVEVLDLIGVYSNTEVYKWLQL
ncbi:hypothetical protein [Paenibacillus herberti]